MKNIFKILLLAFFSIAVFSCKEDDKDPIITVNEKGSVTADKSSVVLNEVNADQVAIKFMWIDPVFSSNVAEDKFLEFGKTGSNFSPVYRLELPNDVNELSVNHLQMNNIMASLGLAPEQINQVQVRLASELNESNIYYSEPLALQVTPYTPNPDLIFPKINVPGGYAGAAGYQDWTPSNSPNLFSPEKNNQYRGFIFVTNPNSEFKFTINQDWAGDKGEASSTGNTGVLVQDGESNIKAALAGTYYLKVNWTGNTYSTAIANFGMIGDATPTGWGSDTDFVYNPATKNWEIASIALTTSGVFKFRANDDWAMKFQPASADQTLVSGTAVQTFLSSEGTVNGDPSYKIGVAGNYKVVLDLHNAAYYKLTLTKL